LYSGLDLRGWKTATPDRWQPDDWKLVLKDGPAGEPLMTEEKFGDCEIILDCHPIEKGNDPANAPKLILGGVVVPLPAKGDQWTRFILQVRGDRVTFSDGTIAADISSSKGASRGTVGIVDTGKTIEFANLYVRSL
jgi:hypothetical protein